MELLALGKPIKKPPRSDERDGELFCGTPLAVYGFSGAGQTFLVEGRLFDNETNTSLYTTSVTTSALDEYLQYNSIVGYGSGSRIRFQFRKSCTVSYLLWDVGAGSTSFVDKVDVASDTWTPYGQVGWIIIWS